MSLRGFSYSSLLGEIILHRLVSKWGISELIKKVSIWHRDISRGYTVALNLQIWYFSSRPHGALTEAHPAGGLQPELSLSGPGAVSSAINKLNYLLAVVWMLICCSTFSLVSSLMLLWSFMSSHLQFHTFTISVRVTLAVSAGDRFGDSEAVVPTGPLLCHPSALWPRLPQADPRGTDYSASRKGLFSMQLKAKLLADSFFTLDILFI